MWSACGGSDLEVVADEADPVGGVVDTSLFELTFSVIIEGKDPIIITGSEFLSRSGEGCERILSRSHLGDIEPDDRQALI